MELRVLGSEDVETYVPVRTRAVLEEPRAFSTSHAEQLARPLSKVAEQLTPLPGNFVLGAFMDSQLVGTTGCWRDTQAKSRYKATVWGVYVAPEQRGSGVGRALLEDCVARARAAGLEVLLLAVAADNRGAKALYESVGFQAFGVEPDAFRVDGEGVTEVHMRLELV